MLSVPTDNYSLQDVMLAVHISADGRSVQVDTRAKRVMSRSYYMLIS